MIGFYYKNDNKKKTVEKNERFQNLKLFMASIKNIFILKQSYKSIIPLKTYTCWHTKELPALLRKFVD